MKHLSFLTVALSLIHTTHLISALPHPANLTSTHTSYPNISLAPREIPIRLPLLHTTICRGLKLSWAMQLPAPSASLFLTPINSPFDGTLRDDLHHWGYTEISVRGFLCDFDTTHHLTTAFGALGIDPRSEARGGPNRCFHVQHQYADSGVPVGRQGYWVDEQRYRMTGAQHTIGINAASGIVFFLNRLSAEKAAQRYWDLGPKRPRSEELPALRSSSDIAWGFWSRENWGRLGGIRAFMSLMVVNSDTLFVIEQVLSMYNGRVPRGQRVDGVQPWPGTTFDVDEVEGQALLGSPNGLAAGFFLAQHKQQLGGNRVVDKITVFRSEQYGALANLLFWVN